MSGNRCLFERKEHVAGGCIYVDVTYAIEEGRDGRVLPALSISEGGTYVAIGRPWSRWRLQRVRARADRSVARLQARHDAALREIGYFG